uniref:Uncharacterized protein n=1 Tax=Bracon brevicornis TaxID=1563983 RepID=A0A6V7L3P5_9HYME
MLVRAQRARATETLCYPLQQERAQPWQMSHGIQQMRETLLLPSARAQLRTQMLRLSTLEEINEQISQLADRRLTMEDLESQLEVINVEWADSREHHQSLCDALPPDHGYFSSEKYMDPSGIYRASQRTLTQLKARVRAANQQSENSNASEFSGRYADWKEISDIFQSLVGSKTDIAPVIKMARRKEKANEPAASLLATLNVTGENYERAWAKLEARYENPRLIAASHFNKLLNMDILTSKSGKGLMAITQAVTETVDSLRSLDASDSQIWEMFAAHILRRSMDQESRGAWELKLGNRREFPTLNEIAEFAEARARGLENLECTNKSSKSARKHSTKAHVATGDSTPSNNGAMR